MVIPATEYKCKRCNRAKGSVNRWWIVKIDGPVFSFRDFRDAALGDFDFAICGAECLDKEYREHVERILQMSGFGSGMPRPRSWPDPPPVPFENDGCAGDR
ncbi:MAG: hypothetical protein ACE145_20910 [Terriglobia bacterium]